MSDGKMMTFVDVSGVFASISRKTGKVYGFGETELAAVTDAKQKLVAVQRLIEAALKELEPLNAEASNE